MNTGTLPNSKFTIIISANNDIFIFISYFHAFLFPEFLLFPGSLGQY